MKYLILSATIMGLLILSPVASADGRKWRSYDRHFDNGFYGRDRYRGNGFYRNRNPARFGRYSRPRGNYWQPRGNYWNFSIGSRYRRDRFDSGALLGGIVLGSVLGHSVASSRYDNRYERSTVPYSSTRTRVISRTPVTSRSSAPQRRLLRDLSGRCYEIVLDNTGTENRVELDPSACNF